MIIEPDVANLEYIEDDAELPIKCEVTDSNPAAGITWIKVGDTSVYSTDTTITVGSQNTGEFLCTGLNGVGPSLTASITVKIRGRNSALKFSYIIMFFSSDFPRRLQIEANDYRSSVRLHFPLK